MEDRIKSALIITYYKSDNYGAFLQTFALQEFLKSQNIDTYVYKYSYLSSNILGKIYKILKKQKKRSIEEINYHTAMSNRVLDEQKLLNLTEDTNKDITIIGSDEVWNVKNIGAPHNKFFFCKNKKSKKTISYAACSGNSNLKYLKIFPYAINGIKNLNEVSVRDELTEKLVKNIRHNKIYRVLDPTFLIDFNQYIPKKEYKEKYIFVYSYGLNKEAIDSIILLAKKQNLKIVATGKYFEWADYNPTPTPFEWISLIKNAEFVVTSTFHGTVLSIQQNKNFAVFNYSSPKIKNVLKELKLINRGVNQWNTLDYLYGKTIDYDVVNFRMDNLVKESKNFLLKNINNDTYQMIENNQIEKKQIEAYIARHKDSNVRWNSRSGGAFTAISDYILDKKGIIYGATLNENLITEHVRADNAIDRDKMRGSKYVQSNMTKAINLIKEDLLNDKCVLFTGTSCQVDAINKYAEIVKKKENLVTIDFICHGVPSPQIFKDYLKLYNNVENFNFRNKLKFGWGDHKETIKTSKKEFKSDIYTKMYYKNYISRPCCYECPYTSYERRSDITIADAWGIEKILPGFNSDDSGASLIIVNTKKGKEIINNCLNEMEYKKITRNDIQQPVLEGNGLGVILPPNDREKFWEDYKKYGIEYVTKKYSTNNFKDKLKLKIRPPHKIRFFIKKVMKKN